MSRGGSQVSFKDLDGNGRVLVQVVAGSGPRGEPSSAPAASEAARIVVDCRLDPASSANRVDSQEWWEPLGVGHVRRCRVEAMPQGSRHKPKTRRM
jgi:hypothetical protein